MRRALRAMVIASAFVVVPARVEAFEVSGGVSVGGIVAGTVPRLALSPHASIAWPLGGGFLFAARDLCTVLLPMSGGGAGVNNHTSVAFGYASTTTSVSAGPSLSLYFMPVCDAALCGQVAGVALGGHLQTDVYFAGPLGVSVNANVTWIEGRSLLLYRGAAAMVVLGPVLRWSSM